MATKKLTFTEQPNRTWKASFKEEGGGKMVIFLERIKESDISVFFYPDGIEPCLLKKIETKESGVMIELNVPADINVDIISKEEVLSGVICPVEEKFSYTVPAANVIFDDGGNFQSKLDAGKLKGEKGDKGDKGDKGATGATGPKGDKGDKGDTGARGATGPKGDAGEDGSPGMRGKRMLAYNGVIVQNNDNNSAANIVGHASTNGDYGPEDLIIDTTGKIYVISDASDGWFIVRTDFVIDLPYIVQTGGGDTN